MKSVFRIQLNYDETLTLRVALESKAKSAAEAVEMFKDDPNIAQIFKNDELILNGLIKKIERSLNKK